MAKKKKDCTPPNDCSMRSWMWVLTAIVFYMLLVRS